MTTEPAVDAAAADLRRATPHARLALGTLFISAIVLALLCQYMLLPWFDGQMRARDADAAIGLLRGAVWAIVAFQLVAVVALAANARRTWQTGESPPPGAWVFRDTPIVRGTAARKRAVLAAAVAAIAFMLAIGFLIVVERMASALRADGAVRVVPAAAADGAR